MIIRGTGNCVKWLNAFPPLVAYQTNLALEQSSFIGRPLECDKHCKVAFGAYVQANNQNNPTNTDEERTIDGIFF